MLVALKAMLPILLPAAMAWMEMQAEIVCRDGRPLSHDETVIAQAVGVKNSSPVRVLLVDPIPHPDDPALRQAALHTGQLGPETIGLTLGCSILLVRGCEGSVCCPTSCGMSVKTRHMIRLLPS